MQIQKVQLQHIVGFQVYNLMVSMSSLDSSSLGSSNDSGGTEADGQARKALSLRARVFEEIQRADVQRAEFSGLFGFNLLEKMFPQRAVTLRQTHMRVMKSRQCTAAVRLGRGLQASRLHVG